MITVRVGGKENRVSFPEEAETEPVFEGQLKEYGNKGCSEHTGQKEGRYWIRTPAFHPSAFPLAPPLYSCYGEFCRIDSVILEQGHRAENSRAH